MDKDILEINEISGSKMYDLMKELYPICRSITGDGVRQTLKIISKHIQLSIHEVPTGTKVFDWTVPKEWNIRDAYVKNSKGDKVIDFKKSNLHVLNYSIPVNKKLTLEELREHLYTLPEYPDWIPYLTSYYNENWGFCLSQKDYDKLKDDMYEVVIDSSLEEGSLTYGEYYIKGETEEEVLFTCYVCHPSMCNDNLSGIVVLTYIAQIISKLKLKKSYRFLFIPETIGSITWLSRNEKNVSNIKYGLVVTCCGDNNPVLYKKSRMGNTEIDNIVQKVLLDSKQNYTIKEFVPWGSDERQFCSPGFNLPVGCLTRGLFSGNFEKYHTSADNFELVKPEYLKDTLEKCIEIIYVIENNATYINLNPKCEPQLGKRGLYRAIGSQKKLLTSHAAMFWILNKSDGNNSLLDIANHSGLSFREIKNTADLLVKEKLLKEI
ncbi:hypothetical protein CLTEP_12790 [Clostridium tepidiprofundi DSM 19306]|uniref:Polysaccharide biosynthesis protein with aminopeptidase-like domain protein n=1 Tax=Clostridium tepidiprofundi DSM 19306 TaxID=1121338 RepID=A0A151B4G8_9CLOT|nr:DUF4910 domain-containing protein [Clostridium tepidiprofundi]KYH34814.1 hypothetical protein CLTEP_12790 [Clostridium tepidiprofundi DSM 19306]